MGNRSGSRHSFGEGRATPTVVEQIRRILVNRQERRPHDLVRPSAPTRIPTPLAPRRSRFVSTVTTVPDAAGNRPAGSCTSTMSPTRSAFHSNLSMLPLPLPSSATCGGNLPAAVPSPPSSCIRHPSGSSRGSCGDVPRRRPRRLRRHGLAPRRVGHWDRRTSNTGSRRALGRRRARPCRHPRVRSRGCLVTVVPSERSPTECDRHRGGRLGKAGTATTRAVPRGEASDRHRTLGDSVHIGGKARRARRQPTAEGDH